MTNNDLLRLFAGFNLCAKLQGAKFCYAISKNKRNVINEIESLQEGIKFSEEYERYDKERIILCELHCEKDNDNKPLMTGNQYKIIDRVKFNIAHDELKANYNGVLESRTKQVEEYNKLLDEETKLALHLVDIENVPENISVEQYDSIFEMIKE